MSSVSQLKSNLIDRLGDKILDHCFERSELTLTIHRDQLLDVCFALREDATFKFEQLIDVTVVDYLDYGHSEWLTDDVVNQGFDRGVMPLKDQRNFNDKQRFAVVYHLLSLSHNHRCRLKVFLDASDLKIPSVDSIWNSANWFEREAFDLFGVLFDGHPDLRRILTDYGFSGHPFRKDFPLIGEVEMRYDAVQQRVVYEPVSITPRTLVPKVIREDSRYHPDEKVEKNHG